MSQPFPECMSTMFNDFIIFENYFRFHPRLENALCIACFFAIAVQHCSTFLFHSQSGRNYSTDLLFLYRNSSKFYKHKTLNPTPVKVTTHTIFLAMTSLWPWSHTSRIPRSHPAPFFNFFFMMVHGSSRTCSVVHFGFVSIFFNFSKQF